VIERITISQQLAQNIHNQMPGTGQQLPIKERVSTYLYLSSLYFVTVGILYLWGYWRTFDLNILEYLSLADILKSTAYPIASAFIFFLIGVMLGSHLPQRGLQPGDGKNTRIGKILKRLSPFLAAVYAVGVYILLFSFDSPQKWNYLPMLIAIPVALLVNNNGLFESPIPPSKYRMPIILLIIALPIYSFGYGALNAAKIVDGKEYKYVVSQVDGINISNDADASQRLRFLGQAGDFLFLLHPAKNTLIIMKYEQAKILQLKRIKVTN
jgi:hypothetical protein